MNRRNPRAECPDCGLQSRLLCEDACQTYVCQTPRCSLYERYFFYDAIAGHTVPGHDPRCDQISYSSTDEDNVQEDNFDEEEEFSDY